MVTLGSLLAVLAPGARRSGERPVDLAGTGADLRSGARKRWPISTTSMTRVNFDRYTLTYSRYARLRDEAASLAAAELGLPAAMMRDAWARSDLDKQTALLAAMSQLGVPYRSRMSEPGVGFDCSGLVMFACGDAGHGSAAPEPDQINAPTRGRAVRRRSRRPGVLPGPREHVPRLTTDGPLAAARQDVEITFLTARCAPATPSRRPDALIGGCAAW